VIPGKANLSIGGLQSVNQEIAAPSRKDIARFAGAPPVCHNVLPE
jgi:hypothetical protein